MTRFHSHQARWRALSVNRVPPRQHPEDRPHKLFYALLVRWFLRQFVQSTEAMLADNYMVSWRALKRPVVAHLIPFFDRTSPWQSPASYNYSYRGSWCSWATSPKVKWRFSLGT